MSARRSRVETIRRAYRKLVLSQGVPAPTAKRLDLQPPVSDDGVTDCWTHAWEVARATGGRYVEGVARPRAGAPFADHAWVEEDSPLGPRVVETTVGYEDAVHYIGIPVDCTRGGDVDRATQGQWPRSSVLQVALGAGFDPPQVLAMTHPR